MSVISLISSALDFTGTILKFIEGNRGWKIKQEVEDIMEEINGLENMEAHLRDNQKLDELRDTLDLKLRVFGNYLEAQAFLQKED